VQDQGDLPAGEKLLLLSSVLVAGGCGVREGAGVSVTAATFGFLEDGASFGKFGACSLSGPVCARPVRVRALMQLLGTGQRSLRGSDTGAGLRHGRGGWRRGR